MSEPIREQVLTAIVARLRGMTGERPGLDGLPWGHYPTDPVVVRGYKDEGQVNEFPSLFVTRRPGSAVTERTTVGDMQGVRHTFLIDIFGYVKTADGVLAGTWLERLWDDVFTTLMADWTLGGICEQLTFDSEDDYDEDDVKAGFRLSATAILYESKRTSG